MNLLLVAAQRFEAKDVKADRGPSTVYLPLPHRYASRLFGHIIGVCAESKLAPHESVVRAFLALTNAHRSRLPVSVRSWSDMRMDFEAWIELLVRLTVCECIGEAPHRVLWMAPPATRFECVQYLSPLARYHVPGREQLMTYLKLHPLQHATFECEGLSKLEQDRFALAQCWHKQGPPLTRSMSFGRVLELIRVLLKQKVLVFHHERICSVATCTHPV
jgi:hypothetical protein